MPASRTWPRVSIEAVCVAIVDCVNRTAPVVDRRTPYKMIRTTNVRDGWIDLSNTKCVTEETYKRWTRRQLPKRGDIVLTREAPLGEVGMIRTEEPVFLGQRLVSYRADSEKLDSRFLLYSFQTHDLQAQIKALGSGATVEHMRVPDAKKLTLLLPPIDVQRQIGSILSAYDDLIENNTRRIVILEEMARALYQEWFVHFRFPGHEHVPLVDSSLGPIPEGWDVKPASEVLEVNPKLRSGGGGPKYFLPMSGLSEHSMLISSLEIKETRTGARFQNGDTLLARITPCLENGKTGYVDFLPSDSDVAHGSTEFIVLRGRSICSEFVYLLARSDEFRRHAITSMSGATGRQRVRNECFDTFYLAEPDPETVGRFKRIVEPMFHAISLLAKKNNNLRATRDLLLPKLISGEIDVSALSEEPVAEAAD